jgi:sugar phosphate permease
MDSHGSAAPAAAESHDVGKRARRRIAYRLLPFVFLIYVVNYIDRVNVSFANLRMSADLGFSDRVYGLGVGMFYLTYVLLEIPGAVSAKRWSARKWIVRIMISWGIVTALTGFVHTTGQFYAARFLLGVGGMLVNGWHSDKTNERHWHTGIPVPAAGLIFFLASFTRREMALTIAFLLPGSGFLFAYFPTFWAIPTTMLSEAAAAASFGLINSIGQLGGFTGNYAIGFLNDRAHSLAASFAFIAVCLFCGGRVDP